LSLQKKEKSPIWLGRRYERRGTRTAIKAFRFRVYILALVVVLWWWLGADLMGEAFPPSLGIHHAREPAYFEHVCVLISARAFGGR